MSENWEIYHEQFDQDPSSFHRPIDEQVVYSALFRRYLHKFLPDNKKILILGSGGNKSTEEFIQIMGDTLKLENDDQVVIADLRIFTKQEILCCQKQSFEAKLIQLNGLEIPFARNSFNIVITHSLFDCINYEKTIKILSELI